MEKSHDTGRVSVVPFAAIYCAYNECPSLCSPVLLRMLCCCFSLTGVCKSSQCRSQAPQALNIMSNVGGTHNPIPR